MRIAVSAGALFLAVAGTVGVANAVTPQDAYTTVVRSCNTAGISTGACGTAIDSLLGGLGPFDNRRAIGRSIAQAARDLGIEDEVDSILSGQGGQNSAVVQGFDDALGTADIGTGTGTGAPDTTADFGDDGASTLGDNDNDGGEGSPG